MVTHDYLFYIKQDRWDEFLREYERFGFKREGGCAHPDYVSRLETDGRRTQICISEPCVNMWDNEDKNQQREIWVWLERHGYGSKDVVAPYIQDLFDAGYVEQEGATTCSD